MIVVIAGMQRSGSTFSFNVVTRLLESRGRVAHFVSDNLGEVLAKGDTSDHVIIKTHNPCPDMCVAITEGTIRCICTVRRPEDAVLSWSSTFGFSIEESIPVIKNWLDWHRKISVHAINVRFDLIESWPSLAVYQIGSNLLNNVKFSEAISISRSFKKHIVREYVKGIDRESNSVTDIGFSFYDAKTLFHRDHISKDDANIAKKKLRSEDLYNLRQELAPYVNKNGKYKW